LSIKISDRSAIAIRDLGVAVLLFGGVFAAWGIAHFSQLPNYLRLAILLPFLVAKPMISVDLYRNWESVHGYWRGQAIGFLLAPPLVAAGSVIWYLIDRGAKA
jgi:hypothetical protein